MSTGVNTGTHCTMYELALFKLPMYARKEALGEKYFPAIFHIGQQS